MDVNKYRILIKRDGTREVQFINNEMFEWQKCELPEVHEEKEKVKRVGFLAICISRVHEYAPCITNKIFRDEDHAKSELGELFIALGPKIEWEEEE